MGRIKTFLACTNPIAIITGIPFIFGIFLGVLGFRLSKDVRETAKITAELLEK